MQENESRSRKRKRPKKRSLTLKTERKSFMKDKSTKNTINTRKNSKRPCRRIHRRLTR
jgi:hypothetical protein